MDSSKPIVLAAPPTDGSETSEFYMASEPLPMNSDVSEIKIVLADFGTGKWIFWGNLLGLRPKLSDTGKASWIDKHLTELIQPCSLRAPEVILGAEWDTTTDIWNAGCVVRIPEFFISIYLSIYLYIYIPSTDFYLGLDIWAYGG